MAKLSSDLKYVIAEEGDSLTQIAVDYGGGYSRYKTIAAINHIPNPDLIHVGQKIYLDKASAPPPADTSTNVSMATVDHFGYQTNSSGTLFATWSWSKSNTEHYEVEWCYDTGDSVWFVGTKSTTTDKQSTYSMPANAKRVRFRVKPISEKRKSNGKETSYWTASWSTAKIYSTNDNPPVKPPTPTVEIVKYKLTASLDNLDVNATQIQFKVVKNDSSTYKTGLATISTGHAEYSCTVAAGDEYKVACRSYNGEEYSDWSDYSANETTVPAAPSKITECKAQSASSVYLKWAKSTAADSYTIEYTTKKEYFDGSDQVTAISPVEGIEYTKTGLESGQEYFFRVKAVNAKGESDWSPIVSVKIGKKPSAPTTWTSTTTVITGETLSLYWVHNVEDGSSQTKAELELYIGENKSNYTLASNSVDDGVIKYTPLSDSDKEKGKANSCLIDTSAYAVGTKIEWRVRTAGITGEYGDWSVLRTANVHAPVTLELNLLDSESNEIDVLESFPCYISGVAGPRSQRVLGYHVSIISNDIYETVDRVGNAMTVNNGEEVYSKFFDVSQDMMLELSAGNIDLANGVKYTIKCVVSMDSGLVGESSLDFTVSWADFDYEPNAEISLDKDTYATHICPVCEAHRIVYYKVLSSAPRYIETTIVIDRVYGSLIPGALTTNGRQVYSGTTDDGEDVYYCKIEEVSTIENVTLSVYRREFDGRFTELASGLPSSKKTFITDPHPALDFARYRIVATDDTTGAVSYCDLPGYPVGGTAAIFQWDEAWSTFDSNGEDALEQPAWSGSMLKLPYNIDVSDSNKPDVELVEYIGREHPVGYYGTQRGSTSTWNVVIRKDDEETLYAIRRLQNWMGNVYVREPSGSGYWANVNVSFSQKHRELTIPVTFTITRVEGGV